MKYNTCDNCTYQGRTYNEPPCDVCKPDRWRDAFESTEEIKSESDKLQHTPGPWKYQTTSATDNKLDIIITPDSSKNIGAIGWTYNRDESSIPNARLIAAAPDMLEALISVYQIYIDRDICCDNEFIKSVIEKATGMSIEEILK